MLELDEDAEELERDAVGFGCVVEAAAFDGIVVLGGVRCTSTAVAASVSTDP